MRLKVFIALKDILSYIDIKVGAIRYAWNMARKEIYTRGRLYVTSEENPRRHKRIFFFCLGSTAPSGPEPLHCRGFTITLRHTTLVRTTLDE